MTVSAVSSLASRYYTATTTSTPMTVAAALVALRANSRAQVSVSDTAQAITANFADLARFNNNLRSVAVTDAGASPPGVITISAAQYAQQTSRLLSKLADAPVLSVTGLQASRAAAVQADVRVASFTVEDNSSELSGRMTALQEMGKLSAIRVSTPQSAMTFTADGYAAVSAGMSKITTGGIGVQITQATAAQAVALAADARVRRVSVLDSASGIVSRLDGLQALGSRLQTLRSNGATVLEVTANQYWSGGLVLGKLYRGHDLAIQGAATADVAAMAANRRVVSIDIEDSGANVAARLADLSRLGSDLRQIRLTDAATPLRISSQAFSDHEAVLARITSEDGAGWQADISGASVHQARTLRSDSRVSSISVADTAAAVSGALDDLKDNEKLNRIELVGRPRPIALTAAQLGANNVLGRIDGQYSLSVSGVQASAALALAQGNSRITSLSVTDQGARVLASLDDLAALGGKLGRISLQDPATPLALTAARWASAMGTLAKIDGGYSVALSAVSASAAVSLADDSRVQSVSVRDSAQAVSSALNDLHALGASLLRIELTDPDSAVSITGAQWATQGSTLSKMGESSKWSVRAAQAAQASALAADARVQSVGISDSSRNIAAHIGALQAAITSNNARTWNITQQGAPTVMALTASQLTASGAALGRINGPYSVSVSAVTVAQATTVAQTRGVVSISVLDNAANLSNAERLGELAGLGQRLSRINQTDLGTAVNLTAADWGRFQATLGKTVGGIRVALTAVGADQVQALSSDSRVRSMSVSDTGSRISANLSALQAAGTTLTAVVQTDTDTPIALTMRQVREGAGALSKLGADSRWAVRDASVADADLLLGSGYAAVDSIQVRDTGARVAAGLVALESNAKLTAFSLSDPNVAMSLSAEALQAADAAGLMGKAEGSLRLNVGSASSADVARLSNDARVVSFQVADTAEAIADALTGLTASGRKLNDIRITDGAPLVLSFAQWTAHQGALSKISTAVAVTVEDVSAARAASVAHAARVASVTVRDSAAQVTRHLDALQSIGPGLTGIALTDAGTPDVGVTARQVDTHSSALAKLEEGGFRLAVTGATTAQALVLGGDSRVRTMTVVDSGANVAQALSDLGSLGGLTSIRLSDPANPMTLNAADYSARASTLALIEGAYTVRLTDVSASGAAGLQADAKVVDFAVRDSTSQLADALVSLNGMSKLSGLTVRANDGLIRVTQSQVDTLDRVLGLLAASDGEAYGLRVTGVSMDRVEDLLGRDDVDSLTLAVSSQDLSRGWGDLQPFADRVASITLPADSQPIALSHEQWMTQAGLLDRVSAGFSLAVMDVPVAGVSFVAADDRVSAIGVTDSAASISGGFDSLIGLGSKLASVEISDGQDVVVTQEQFDSASGAGLIAKFLGEHEIVVSE